MRHLSMGLELGLGLFGLYRRSLGLGALGESFGGSVRKGWTAIDLARPKS